jgi:hypothetical protein
MFAMSAIIRNIAFGNCVVLICILHRQARVLNTFILEHKAPEGLFFFTGNARFQLFGNVGLDAIEIGCFGSTLIIVARRKKNNDFLVVYRKVTTSMWAISVCIGVASLFPG